VTAHLPEVSPRRRVHGYRIDKLRNRQPEWFREDFLALLELLRRGEIHPVVSERLPLTEVRRAHELLESSAATGKLVLVLVEEGGSCPPGLGAYRGHPRQPALLALEESTGRTNSAIAALNLAGSSMNGSWPDSSNQTSCFDGAARASM
jgi:hypothetical protein